MNPVRKNHRRFAPLSFSLSRLSSALAVIAVLGAESASGATNLLDGPGGSWNDPANWSLGTVPSATNALLLDATSPLVSSLDLLFTSQTLAFDTGSGVLNINANASGTTGQTLTLTGGTNALGGTSLLETSATTTGTINLGATAGVGTLTLALGADGAVNVANAGATLNFGANSILSGAFSLNKTGSGTLTLAGANTFGGAGKNFTLTSGTVNLNNAGALGSTASTFIINGGTLNNTSAGAVTLTNRAITLGGNFTFTGTQNLNLGTGAVTLTAARQIQVDAGTLTIGGAISGATFGITKSGAGTLSLGGVVGTTTGGLNVLGGTLILGSTANTFTGNIAIDGNTSVLQITGNNGNATSGPMGIVTGGTAYKTVTLSNGGTFRTTTSYNDNTPTAALPGNGVVFVFGAGGGTLDTPSGVTLTLDDGAGTGTATTAAQLQGSGNLTKTGTGTLSLGNGTSNFSNFTGQIFINAGTLTFGGTSGGLSPLGATSAGTTIASGAALNFNASTNAAAEPLTVSGTGISNGGVLFNNSGTNSSFPGPVTLASSVRFGVPNAGNMALTGLITGGAGVDITVAGAGTGSYVPAGANTYLGDTHLLSASSIPNSDSVGSASNGTLVSGPYGLGTLFFDGGRMRASTGTGSLVGNAVNVTADTTFSAGANKTLTFSGPVTLTGNRTLTQLSNTDIAFTGAVGGGSLTVGTGTVGTILLAGANTYTGATNINAGTLALASTASLDNPTINAQTGGTLLFRGSNTIGGTTTPVITLAGGLTQSAAGTLSLVDGTANTLTINSATPATPALLIGSGGLPGYLNMELGVGAADRIVLGTGVQTTVDSGGAILTLNVVQSGGYDGASRVLISSPTTDLTAGGSIVLNTTGGNWGGYNLSLNTTASAVSVSSTLAGPAPAVAYFKGNNNGFWNGFSGGAANISNFTTDSAGTIPATTLIDSSTDVHLFATGAANLATTLGQDFTIKTLTSDGLASTAMSIAGGGGALTINPASASEGITISAGSGTLGISANVNLAGDQTWSNNSASLFTVSGSVGGNGNLVLNNTSTAGITITGAINHVGSITRSASPSNGQDNLTGVIGANVTAITQNNPSTTSSLILDGANTAYTGTTTINAGRLDARNTGTGNSILALGTGAVVLNGGTLDLRANGTASFQVVTTGNGTTSSNLTVGGTGTVDVQRFNGANTGNTILLNNLTIGGSQLNVTGTNSYSLGVAGTTTITGAATFNPTTAQLNLLGKVVDNGNPVVFSGGGTTRLLNAAGGANANSLAGPITINGATLIGYAPAADVAVPGSNSLGTADIVLQGTNPVLRLAPSLAGGLNTPPAAGLIDKSYTGVNSLAVTNFLGATQPITTGTVASQNPTGVQTVANLNLTSQATATTASHQYTGLINIVTGGVYNFEAFTDDGGNLFIDGNAPIVTGNTTVTGSFYLTPGLHTLTSRWNNNGGNGGDNLRYQGPDTGGTLLVVPDTAFKNATASQLATNFGNNITVAATSNASIDVSSNTTVGAIAMTGVGTGTTLNVTGSGDVNTLTAASLTLTDNLTISNPTAHFTVNGGVTTSGGTAFNLTKSGFGTLTVKGTYAPTGQISLGGGTLSLANDGAGSNGTISQGNNVLISASGTTLDVRGNGANTGNTVAFGSLSTPSTATLTSTTFTGGDGYSATFASLALPGTTGASTTLVANTNVTITGNVTSQMSGFGTGNFDTLFLSGTATGSAIQGSIGEAGTFTPLTGGYTRIIKQGTGTWTLSGANTYTGITQVQNGTLKAGASNILSAANLQGIDATATGAGVTATFDFNGFDQTLNGTNSLILGGSTTTSTPLITGAGSTVTLNGGINYIATNNPLGGTVSVGTLDLNGGNRTFTVNDSSSAPIDLTISSSLQDGILTKTGAGVLQLTGSLNLAGIFDNAGTILITGATTLNSTPVTVNGGIFDLGGTTQNGNNFTLTSGSIINGTLTTANFLKQGPGTLTLGSANTVSTVTINQGVASTVSNPATPSTVNLNFAAAGAPVTDIFTPSATLTLGGSASSLVGGGALTLTGAPALANSQTFGSTLVAAGASSASATIGAGGTVALNLGALTRNTAGTIDFVVPAGAQSATNGITATGIGAGGNVITSAAGTAFATVGGNDWAANSADSPGNIVAASVAGTGATSLYTAASSAATFSGHADVTASFAATSGATVESIRFNSGTSLTLTLAGVNTVNTGGVLFGSGITTGATITGGSLRPGAGQELVLINNEPGVAVAISSVLADAASGAATVTYRGNPTGTSAGSFNVNANNTYTGPTYITSSRVNSATAGVTTPFGTGPNAIVHVDGNTDGQFFTGQNVTIANPFVIVGTGFNENGTRRGVIRLDSSTTNTPTLSGTITLAGDSSIGNNSAITGAGAALISGDIVAANNPGVTSYLLNKVGTGVLRVTGNNSQTETRISAGALRIDADSALGVASAPLTFGGGTLQFETGMTLPATRSIVLPTGITGTIDTGTLPSGTSTIIEGVISGPGALTKAYATASTLTNNLTLAGVNTFTGAVTVSHGYLTITNSGSLGTGAKNINLTNGTAGNPELYLDPAAGATPGVGIDLASNMTLVLSNTSTPAMTVNTGTVVNASGDNIIRGPINVTSGGGGAAFNARSGSLTLAGNITPIDVGRALFFRGNGTGLASGIIANGTTVDMPITRDLGTGTWTLSGANTYTGLTTVTAGTFKLGNPAALGGRNVGSPTTDNSTVVNSGAVLDLGGQVGVSESIRINGTGIGGTGALINSGSAASIGNALAGLRAAGTTGITLNGAPSISFAGGGTGSGAAATASIGVTAASFTIAGGTQTYTVAPTVTIGGGTGATATAVLTAGVVTGITVTAPGNGFSGAPTITFSGGTVGTAGTAPTGTGNNTNFVLSSINVTNAGTGYTAPLTATLNNASGASTALTANAAGIILAGDSRIGGTGDITVNSFIAETGGARALTKVGTNALFLEGASTYTGATTVQAGDLVVDGSLSASSAVTVTDDGVTGGLGGSLSGSGTVGNVLVTAFNPGVTEGGTLNPGSIAGTAGILNVGTGTGIGLDLALGGTLSLDIGGSLAGEYDRVNVASGSGVNIAGTLSGNIFGGFTPTENLLFVVVNNGIGATSGVFANQFNLSGVPTVTIDGVDFYVSYTANYISEGNVGNTIDGGNDIALLAVPEPAAAFSLLGGLGMLLGMRRRRK